MTLDIVIATFNRADLLRRLLDSIQRARLPHELQVRTIVVDNNSTDATRAVVRDAQQGWRGTLEYRFEAVQSKAAAANNGLSVVDADLVGLLDDDEEIDPAWFEVVERVFRDADVGFISGPYLPRWGAPPPPWLPTNYRAVIGWTEAGDRRLEYGKGFSGVMLGGNAVIRRRLGESVKWYDTALGRVGHEPGTGCEDVDLFQRLLASGVRGLYVPELVIYHFIPPMRLTKAFHRTWCFNRARAQAAADAQRPQPVPHLLGVPRYRVGSALRSLTVLTRAACSGRWNVSNTFGHELAIWELAGYASGILERRRAGARQHVPALG